MRRTLTDKERKEIIRIKERGKYEYIKGCFKTRIDYLSLALLKYLIYTQMTTWRPGFPNQFKGINDKLSSGERAIAVSFLIKKEAVQRKGKRFYCSEYNKLLVIMNEMEKEIKEKRKKSLRDKKIMVKKDV